MNNTDQISSRHKKPYRSDERKKSKHYHRHRSSSKSPASRSPSSPSTSNNHNRSTDRTEKRCDDYNSHRHSSSRNYHPYPSSKHSSRDNSSSTPTDRRTNISSPPTIQSKIVMSDGNNHETSTEDRNRIYNRLKAMNDPNAPTIPINNTSKISCSGPPFANSNGGTQRSRSNLIQIVTTEPSSVSSSSTRKYFN